MDKLKMHSPDLSQQNLSKIRALFPNCVTETTSSDGSIKLAIDFDLLRQELSGSIVEGAQERYHLNWPGKREALLLANSPTAKTLRPSRQESVHFDTTENLFVEGDNLDALKLLQETYLGKIKMIYIDPPYNTGNDLIYGDDFSESTNEYLKSSNQTNESGERLVSNMATSGRFHSNWLNMIYPRLRLARSLLRDDGVIFISIDDNESANLKKVCDEIFGDSSFVADICVVNNLKGRNDKKYIATANERLLMYVKSEEFNEYGLDLTDKLVGEYSLNDTKGKYRLIELRKRGGPDTRAERPNMYYPFYVDPITGNVALTQDDKHSVEAYPVKSDGVEGRWRWGKSTSEINLDLLVGKPVRDTGRYNVYEKDYLDRDDGLRRIKPKSVWLGADYSTDSATKQYRSLMGELDFSNPKPLSFLVDLVTYATDPDSNSIILDFFAGSGTTAHAVMKRNAIDGGNRKFIVVQIPEACSSESKASLNGVKYISDLTKERIRRAGNSIVNEYGEIKIDIGFRVLKIDSSNMSDVYYSPNEFSQGGLNLLIDNIKLDRTDEDLLFQVLLDWGAGLTHPIDKKTIAQKQVFFVNKTALLACFEKEITIELVKELAELQPLRVVFRDDGFTSDALKINAEQVFKQIAPHSEIRTI